MKSCLKHSPPVSPSLSQECSREGSRCGSPPPSTPPTPTTGGRKCVTFCRENEGLEEVFEADDWDRSPTPMTPRLSYEDLLELKKLRLTPPRTAVQRPFTTSPHKPTCKPPISRLAAAPSLTPSKWKNRDDSHCHVDSEILPYLDAVPIQLLPLLDTCSPSESPVPTPPPSATPTPVPTPTPRLCNIPGWSSSSSYSSPSISISTTPIDVSSSASSPPTPTAPVVVIDPPSRSPISSLPPPSSPPSSIQDITPKSSPPRRTPNFQFLPLLPIQEPPKLSVEPPAPKPVEVKRKFHMAFVPLLPTTEPPPPPPALESTPLDSASLAEALASLTLNNETHSESETEDGADSDTGSHHRSHRRCPLYSPSSSTTPSLSSASDTDDIDTESEAPSVFGGSSTPSSPNERDHMDYFPVSASESSANGETNSYFPPMSSSSEPPDTPCQSHHNRQDVCQIARPGQTPPLSVLYPDLPSALSTPISRETLTLSLSSLNHATEIGTHETMRKVTLDAIPSPSLIPPSPLSLYPPSPTAERAAASTSSNPPGIPAEPNSACPATAATLLLKSVGCGPKRTTTFARSSSRLSLCSLAVVTASNQREGSEIADELRPSFTRKKEMEEGLEVEAR